MSEKGLRLFGSGPYVGTIVHGKIDQEYTVENPILVLPNGDIDYFNTMMFTLRRNNGTLAVVVETGSESCHLVNTAREKNDITIILLPNALEKLPDGKKSFNW